jgi:hypothetical protein
MSKQALPTAQCPNGVLGDALGALLVCEQGVHGLGETVPIVVVENDHVLAEGLRTKWKGGAAEGRRGGKGTGKGERRKAGRRETSARPSLL